MTDVTATINYPMEILLRILIFILFLVLEVGRPFQRVIQPEEIWLYRYPHVKTPFLKEFGGPIFKILLDPTPMALYPLLAILIIWLYNRNTAEMCQMCLIPTLSTPLTGTIINLIKLAVGRPRPNFMATCYGSDNYLKYNDLSNPCTGPVHYCNDGRKSFPSGHSGLAFASFGFIMLYIAEKGHSIWMDKGNRWKIFASFPTIFILPVLVAISRTCDYRHHWQDVLVGGLIGSAVTYIVFRIYYPMEKDRSKP